MSDYNSNPRIIVAMDFNDAGEALTFALLLNPEQCRLKVGKELFMTAGPKLVERFVSMGFDVFLDLKFYDIPNTVAKACAAAAELGIWMVDVHASGGSKMMIAARQALDTCTKRPLLTGVTILTSLSKQDLVETGIQGSPQEAVTRLARLTKSAGLDGVVCSPREAASLREVCGSGFTLVTPGVRPEGSVKDDQTRVMTPIEAIQNGANYLVIGRPITQAEDPVKALESIVASLQEI